MNHFGTAAQIAGAFLVTVTALAGEAAPAQVPIQLICEFKSPLGQEADQRYLLEIGWVAKACEAPNL